mgnify:FL=1
MIPPYFLTETLRLRLLPINWNATFYINYLIISLLEKEEAFLFQLFQLFFQHIPSTLLFIYIYIYYIYN